MLVALTSVLTRRVVFSDQEDVDEGHLPYDEFEPTAEEEARAEALIEGVITSAVQFAEPRDLSLTTARLRNFAHMSWRVYRSREPGERKPELFRYATADFARQRVRLAAMRYAADELPAHGNTVFYPLHYANDSQVTIRGEAYRNQFAVVEHIAASLPFGYDLLVKPHPAFAGQIPIGTLRGIQKRLANVRLLHPSIHAHEVLRRTQALVTINSTTGFEALMFGVPVVTLGQSFYRGKGVTHDVSDPNELPFAIARALREPPAPREQVRRMLAYLERISTDVVPMGIDLSSENALRYAEALVDVFGLRAAVSVTR
jgi:hypothetical protein